MYCKTCGKEVNDQAIICPHCGCQIANSITKEETQPTKKKANVFCIIGFVLSLVSLLISLFGIVAIAGLVLSIVGIIQTNRNNERLKGLGIAGICVSAGSLLYTVYTLIILMIGISLL